jgi:ATP-dependent HslUV protease subunit HslV
MAADKQINAGNTPLYREHPKVMRIGTQDGKPCLIGFSGSVHMYRAWLHWLSGGDEPRWTGNNDYWSMMLVDHTGYVWVRTSSSNGWAPHGRRVWAIGSGCDYALGAMYAGASAERAVVIASKLDVNTGGGVDVVRFNLRRKT